MIDRIVSAEELEVCEEVGRGGFGVVYRGLIKANNKEVAIKQIDLENDQTDIFEINKEIQIISECRLDQITRYLGCFVKHYKLWVIMEFVNGGSLWDLLKPGPIKDERTISLIIREILLALEYLHSQGKIHRDLKSQNILLSKSGEVKLTDFGVSTQLSSNFSRRNTTVGTPYWMAPEVILNNNGGHSFKADIWSLGCCAYEIFNGKPPLQNQYPPMKALRQISKCQQDQDFLGLIGLSGMDISYQFKDFLAMCFVVDTRERYSATKLLNHKFITKYKNVVDKPKLIKRLITNKQLWDQENHITKSHNFYVPTEIALNQKKWNQEEAEVGTERTIQFDLSSIHYDSPPQTTYPSSPSSSKRSTTRESSFSPPASTVGDTEKPNALEYPNEIKNVTNASTKQDYVANGLRPDFIRILNKVFHKLETKNTLTTEQYDNIVSLNRILLELLCFAQYTENQEQIHANKKILVFQYLKYFLKEVTKSSSESAYHATLNANSRVMLQRLIIPSNFSIQNRSVLGAAETAFTTMDRPRTYSEFDEIEHSLFESWIDKMKEKGKSP
ncbi:kinase-like domain-containing protein [Scheffersomyces xylosifermentans]|uniref:kinase-like domain-containing protein n=1 Tax=Scheffersomyces xylosifermentans TaxID=1304137 RepID=UPI00315DCF89